jgi:hypothetical protein
MIRYGLVAFPRPSDSGGFFSNYFSVLSTVNKCVNDGIVPLINTTNSWFNPTCDFKEDSVSDPSINPWDWWFEQDLQEGEITPIGIERGFIPHVPSQFIAQANNSSFKDLADKYCKIRPHILQEEEELYKWYLKGKTTLGVLARGTEMLLHHKEYPKVGPQEWPSVIKFCLEQNPDVDNIFLVSDDLEIVKNIIMAFPQIRFLPHYFRSSVEDEKAFESAVEPWWLYSPTGNPDHRKRLGEECLIQARLLSRCQYFVGAHSGITNAAHFFTREPFKKSFLI